MKYFCVLFVIGVVIHSSDAMGQSNDSISKANDTLFVMQKSAWGAVARSAIVPGWGQFYNTSYWKIPVVVGLSAWFIYNYADNNKLYKSNNDMYLATLDNRYKDIREFYRDQRDLFAIYLGLTYLLTLVDAYVDAHLFDFSVTESPENRSTQLHFRYAF